MLSSSIQVLFLLCRYSFISLEKTFFSLFSYVIWICRNPVIQQVTVNILKKTWFSSLQPPCSNFPVVFCLVSWLYISKSVCNANRQYKTIYVTSQIFEMTILSVKECPKTLDWFVWTICRNFLHKKVLRNKCNVQFKEIPKYYIERTINDSYCSYQVVKIKD